MTANRLLKALILCPLLLLVTQVSWAQKTISGKVLDEKGAPVVGASVVVKGGKIGTTTDATGHFNLNAPAGTTTVVVSYVGYSSKELDVTSSSDVSMTLQPTNTSLSDIVVVGYGTTRKKDLTGSVAAITPKDFNKGVISTPEQLIIGRTPGVTVTPANGEPGAASVINIRGSSSIRSNQEPLYVVDGVPLGGGGTTGTSSGVEGNFNSKKSLIFLNPNDIESITILKDASSAAIYGSRGANGVILITTKSGRGANGGFQFSTNVGVSNPANTYDMLNGPDFLQAVTDAKVLGGDDPQTAAKLHN
jgi:iron complex outermembrane receptor protein